MEAPLLQQMDGYYFAVTVLSLNGKTARKDNVTNGSYAAVMPINIIYLDNQNTDSLVDFLATEINKCDFYLSTSNPAP